MAKTGAMLEREIDRYREPKKVKGMVYVGLRFVSYNLLIQTWQPLQSF
jgi:hypothetical protein